MIKFFKEHWILILVLFLLIIMSLPLLYFGSLVKILNRQNGNSVNSAVSPEIGVCFSDFMEARWLKEQEAMLEEAKDPFVTVKIKVAHHSLARQIQQITYLINRNIKVLIINPVSRAGLDNVLEEARRRGIKIIQYDDLTSGPADFYIGIDYQEMGRIQASTLFQNAGLGNYLVFVGPGDSYKARAIYNGILDVFKDRNASPVITAVNLRTWSAEEAVNKARAILTRQKIDAILAPNDLIAGEIINFIKEQKLPLSKTAAAGAEVAACQRVLNEEQLSTVYFDYQLMARMAIIYAREFIGNRPPKGNNTVIFDKKSIPAYLSEVYPVTKTNVESFLGDRIKMNEEKE